MQIFLPSLTASNSDRVPPPPDTETQNEFQNSDIIIETYVLVYNLITSYNYIII